MENAPKHRISSGPSAGCLVIAGFVAAFLIFIWASHIPGFLVMLKKSKQSEAKTNLGAIFTAEKEFRSKTGVYGKTFAVIGFKLDQAPQGHTSYTYYLCGDMIAPLNDKTHPLPAGLDDCDSNHFIAAAVANLDRDAPLDIWTINERKDLRNLQDDVRLKFDDEAGSIRHLPFDVWTFGGNEYFNKTMQEKNSPAPFAGYGCIDNDTTSDQWTVNEKKDLRNVVNDSTLR